MKTTGYKHLSSTQRRQIEMYLNKDLKLTKIAEEMGKDPSTISKEVKRNRYLHVRANAKNICGIQNTCSITRLCDTCVSGKCKYCSLAKCHTLCDNFKQTPNCKRVLRFPYVCNGCDLIEGCSLPKLFYKADKAQINYSNNISEHKKGYRVDEVKLAKIDKIVSEGVKNNHSLEIIIFNNLLDIAPSTLYRYINDGLLSVKNIDLKRKVRYSARYTDKPKAKPIDYDYLNGRKFSDYCKYISENPEANVWQLDTIEGKKGAQEHTTLSLLHTRSNLQLFFKIESITQSEVIRIFDSIKQYLEVDIFKETFKVILTDNGKEFRDPLSIISDAITGELLIEIFYCDPRRSDQKGKCEKNHEHFREILPKGISMNEYSIADINYISNQVNNYPRRLLHYHAPYQVALFFLNEKVFELNNLDYIERNKVNLKRLK